MNNRYRDAMATVRRYGKPSFFITMTCNPDWSVRGHRASKRALKTTNFRIFFSLPIKLVQSYLRRCDANRLVGPVRARAGNSGSVRSSELQVGRPP